VPPGDSEVQHGSAGQREGITPCLARAWLRPAPASYHPAAEPERPGRAALTRELPIPAPAPCPLALAQGLPVPIPLLLALAGGLSIPVPLLLALARVLPTPSRGPLIPA
jgi:hypothetical protein